MKVFKLNGFDQYDIYITDFLFESTRMFALHNKRDYSIDEHHELEYGFYKGVLFHDLSKESVEPYFFQEKNVFDVSRNGYNAALFYINYGDNYKSDEHIKSVSLHKLNCRTKESICFSKREFNLSGSNSLEDFFKLYVFVGINERYVFLSFSLGQERKINFYLVDSMTGEWLPIIPDDILFDQEQFLIFGNELSNYIVIKTGQYLVEEKERWWKNDQTDRVDEHLIVIKDQEFIDAVKRGALNLRPYVIESCTNDCALSMGFLDSNGIVYYTDHFDTLSTSITRYNPLTCNKEKISVNRIHSNIFFINDQYYFFTGQEGEKATLYALNEKEKIATIHHPEIFLWLDGNCLITGTTLSNGNMRVTSKNLSTNHTSILGEGICYVEVERDIITIIERAGL